MSSKLKTTAAPAAAAPGAQDAAAASAPEPSTADLMAVLQSMSAGINGLTQRVAAVEQRSAAAEALAAAAAKTAQAKLDAALAGPQLRAHVLGAGPDADEKEALLHAAAAAVHPVDKVPDLASLVGALSGLGKNVRRASTSSTDSDDQDPFHLDATPFSLARFKRKPTKPEKDAMAQQRIEIKRNPFPDNEKFINTVLDVANAAADETDRDARTLLLKHMRHLLTDFVRGGLSACSAYYKSLEMLRVRRSLNTIFDFDPYDPELADCVLPKSSATTRATPGSGRLFCSHHGQNDSHATADCLQLKKKAEKQAARTASRAAPASGAAAAPAPANAAGRGAH